jgi:FKBP-type peptidyl-prolyl isomerase-like protein
VATSRRRERELARRRYERRRMREMERRAKTRRRNTILGACVGTVVVIVGIILLAVNLSGSNKNKTTALATSPTPNASPTLPTSPTPPPPAPTKCAAIKPNPPAKGQPKIPDVTGKAPTKLVVKDVKVGRGRAARKGDTVSVLYIGASCSDGSIFDASYKHGNQPFAVKPLGQAQVIAGWNQGLVGVKPGGVRELVIPASLGYGPTGQPPIKPNETLIFLITVKSVKA